MESVEDKASMSERGDALLTMKQTKHPDKYAEHKSKHGMYMYDTQGDCDRLLL